MRKLLLRFLFPTPSYHDVAWWVITAIVFGLAIVLCGLTWGWVHIPGFAAGWLIWQALTFVAAYERRRRNIS